MQPHVWQEGVRYTGMLIKVPTWMHNNLDLRSHQNGINHRASNSCSSVSWPVWIRLSSIFPCYQPDRLFCKSKFSQNSYCDCTIRVARHWKLKCSMIHPNVKAVSEWVSSSPQRLLYSSVFMCISSMHRHPDEEFSLHSPVRAPPVITTIVSLNLCSTALASQ